MTGTERPSLGFDQEFEQLDPTEWAPKPPRPLNTTAVRSVAQQAGFVSREPQLVRGRRTGRNQQLNLKVRPDTARIFYAIADRHGWVLGEAFEHAVALLEKEYGER